MRERNVLRGLSGAILLLLLPACGPAARSTPADPGRGASPPPPRDGPVEPQPGADEATAPPPLAAGPGWTFGTVAIEHERGADGARYPNWVKESYRLESDGVLDYTAYFGGMPIEMNHMDGVRWEAGEAGRAVIDVVDAIVADPALFAALVPVPDDGPAPSCPPPCYRLGLSQDDGDYSFVLPDRNTRAFDALDAAFSALLAAFESATGRPLRPGDLPQS
jgi:hypothetical protein